MTSGVLNLRDIDFNDCTPPNAAARRAFGFLDQFLTDGVGFLLPHKGPFQCMNDQETFAVTAKLIFGQAALYELRRKHKGNPATLFDTVHMHGVVGLNEWLAANALRKTPGALVTGRDTLGLTSADWSQFELLQRGEDGPDFRPWKIYPAGGAVLRTNGMRSHALIAALVGVDGFLTPAWDHRFAVFLAESLVDWAQEGEVLGLASKSGDFIEG